MKNKLGQFEVGHVPHNKGKNLSDYLTPIQIDKIKETQITTDMTGEKSLSWKGGIQNNTRDGKIIWTGTNERKRLSRLNYEKKYGEILKGWIIYHLDKDKDNDEIDNLIAVPRAILMPLNAGRLNSNYHEIIAAINLYKIANKIS